MPSIKQQIQDTKSKISKLDFDISSLNNFTTPQLQDKLNVWQSRIYAIENGPITKQIRQLKEDIRQIKKRSTN